MAQPAQFGTGDLELVFSSPADDGDFDDAATQRLERLRLADLGHRQGLDGFAPLSNDERTALDALERAEAHWRAGQIGISPEFLSQLDRFETRVRNEMIDPASPLRFVTDLASPLDILRKIHQVQNENRASEYRVPRTSDVHASSRDAQLQCR